VIAPVLQHAVDLMNNRRQLIAATHSLLHAEQPSKSDELLTSHRADDFQVLSHDCFLQCFDTVDRVTGRTSSCKNTHVSIVPKCFYSRDAMLVQVLAVMCVYVCMSVCLSHTSIVSKRMHVLN